MKEHQCRGGRASPAAPATWLARISVSRRPVAVAWTLMLGATAIPVAAQTDNPKLVRHTELGAVEGVGGDVETFLGIPFAAPPVGDLRWRPPAPPRAWAGTRDSRRFAPDCIGNERLREGSRAPGTSEDCLYLNIWSPKQARKGGLPVMIWVYGGGFGGGSGAVPYYDGSALAQKGVVVVTFNYRAGILGFLAHPALSKESPNGVSGNYGLLDMLAAFKWVQNNIREFGGNPGRVTVFGESAGASALGLLLTSPLSESAFNQAILQSPGLARPLATLSESEANGLQLGADISALRRADAGKLTKIAQARIPMSRQFTKPRPMGPILDGYVLRTVDVDAFAKGAFHKMPVLVGGNADEGRAFTDRLPVKTVLEYRAYLTEQFGDEADAWERCYPANSDADVPAAVARLFGDSQFNNGIEMLSAAFAKWRTPLWRYRFTGIPGPGRLPATHGDEIPYVFANLGPSSVSMFGSLEGGAAAPDIKLATEMSAAWVSFAAHGIPDHRMKSHWPRFGRRGEIMTFGSQVGAGEGSRVSPSKACQPSK
nr:FumDO [Sphingopyxis sp.]